MGKSSEQNQTDLREGRRGTAINTDNKNIWNMQGTLNDMKCKTNIRDSYCRKSGVVGHIPGDMYRDSVVVVAVAEVVVVEL